jgi:Rad3-related DNA helicase
MGKEISFYTQQKKLIEEIVELSHCKGSVKFFESGTGTGKTLSIIESALQIANETGQKVLVSTSTNALSHQYQKDIANFGYDKKEFVECQGRTNYVSLSLLDRYVKMNMVPTEALQWKEVTTSGLVSDLEEYLQSCGKSWHSSLEILSLDDGAGIKRNKDGSYPDADDAFFYYRAIEKANSDPSIKVILTNHFLFLLLCKTKEKNRKIALPANIILDEGHALLDAATLLTSLSYSPFRMQYLCKALISAEKDESKTWRGQKKFIKLLIDAIKMNEQFESFADISKQGSSQVLTEGNLLNLLRETNTGLDQLQNMLKKRIENNHLNIEISILCSKILRMINHLKIISNEKSIKFKRVLVLYSKKVGYISFSSQQSDPTFFLQNHVWDSQRNSNFALLSGTFFAKMGERICLSRLGIFDTTEKFVSSRLSKKWFSIFPTRYNLKEKISIDIVPEDFPAPPEYDDEDKIWATQIVDRIEKQVPGGKTLFLLSSYRDIKRIKTEMERVGMTERRSVFFASEKNSAATMIDRFRRTDATKNPILVGSKQYWTGIDISSIDNLIIGKLPYPNMADYRWQKMPNPWPVYVYECILNFRQGCGRLIRNDESTGTVYVWDSRIYRNKVYDIERWKGFVWGEVS